MPGFNKEEQIGMLKAAQEEDQKVSFGLFMQWVDSQDFNKNFSHTEYRLLPYLWHRHKKSLQNHPLSDRFQGVYKRTLFYNSQFLRYAVQISDEFTKNGIIHGFVKGLNFLLRVYPSWGTRPMNDIDFLIRESDLDIASNILVENGYLPKKRIRDVKMLKKNSIGFVSKNGISIDLHIRPLSFPIPNFDSNYFLSDLEIFKTQLGYIPLISVGKSVQFTILNGLLEADAHWQLDIFLVDSRAEYSSILLNSLQSFPQIIGMIVSSLNFFKGNNLQFAYENQMPKQYKDFMINQFKDQPVKFRLSGFYWYVAMKNGKFTNPYFKVYFIWIYFRYSVKWILNNFYSKFIQRSIK